MPVDVGKLDQLLYNSWQVGEIGTIALKQLI